MDEFTTELGRALRDDPLPETETGAVVRDVRARAVRRRRNRSAGAALGAAALVATTAFGLAALPGDDRSGPDEDTPGPETEIPSQAPTMIDTTGAVAWSDRTDAHTWEPPTPQPRDPARPCAASDLRLHLIEQDGAMQSTLLFVSVLRTTAGFCTLPGFPALTGADSSGARVTIPAVEDDAPAPPYGETPATIERHETARMTVSFGHNCAAGQGEAPLPEEYSYDDLAVVLGDGGSIPLDRDMVSSCPPQVTRFYRDNAPIEQPVRWDTVIAQLTVPESVPAGGTLVYVVTLHNKGDRDIRLDPCGGYRQELLDNSNGEAAPIKGEGSTYRLSCDGDPVLPAHGQRRYVMELAVPDDAPELDALLQWRLVDTSPDQSGQAYVQITR